MAKVKSMTERMDKFAKEAKAVKPIEKGDTGERVRITHYVNRKHMLMLDRIRLKRMEEGASPSEADKSRLIREAIDLLAKQENM
jgi:hypothetical protein